MPISNQTKDRVQADMHMINSGIAMALAGYLHLRASRDDALNEGDAAEDAAVNGALALFVELGEKLKQAKTAKDNFNAKMLSQFPATPLLTGC